MRKLSKKQSIVIQHLANNDTLTISEAVDIIGFGITYSYNQRRYVGMVLQNMHKKQLIKRVKRGIYTRNKQVKVGKYKGYIQLVLFKG